MILCFIIIILVVALVLIVLKSKGLISFKIQNDTTNELTQSTTENTSSVENDNSEADKEREDLNLVQNKEIYDKFKGIYKTKVNTNGEDVFYELDLYENGTFIYFIAMDSEGGAIGKYSIEGNTIVLDCMYEIFSDVRMKKLDEKRTLEINTDGSIKDTQKNSIKWKEEIGDSEEDVVLKKTSEKLENWSLDKTIEEAKNNGWIE